MSQSSIHHFTFFSYFNNSVDFNAKINYTPVIKDLKGMKCYSIFTTIE